LKKPNDIKEKHLIYLDVLRESGVTNMYGAGEYLERKFGLTTKIAQDYLLYWMKTFGDRKGK